MVLTRGVNEAGKQFFCRSKNGRCLNPDDVNFYRQLSGGVTSAQQLHGSAKSIGGQSSIVKFAWGENADGMKFPDAPEIYKICTR